MERLAIEAVMTELTDAFPQHLAAAAADQVAEDRQWAHRLLERAAREAAKSCDGSPNGLRELAAQLSNLAPGGQPIVPEALAGEEQLEEVAMRQMREALRLAEETNKDTVDEVLRDIQRLPISPSEDPKEGRLPNLEPAIREAAERLRGIRVQQLVEFREHLNGTALPPEYRASLVKACEERLHGVQRNGLAERLAVEALSRTVTHILTVRAKQLYEEEQQWHVRALERRIEEAIRLNAYPDAELAEWDLEALTRDADQIVPGTATVITQHGDTVEAHEFPEFIRQTALALASQPDPEQIAPRLETLEERVASAVRSALPEQPNLGEVGLEALLQKAGEAEGEMRSLLAQEAARRVRASRLRSELKEPAGQMYAQRAQAVQSAWGLWRAFAISTLRKLPPSDMLEEVKQRAIALYRAREKRLGENAMRHLERSALLNAIEASWPQHLQDMDHLREAVYLRAYGQLDPLVQYQKESFEYFQRLLDRIAQDVTKLVFGADFVARPVQRRVRLHEEAMRSEQGRPSKPLPSSLREVKRERPAQLPAPNKRCWCGSGRKYKNCHMAQDEAELTTSSARN
ncbi:MAG: SEC-C metal-binding domain-containing protein [Candidatus Zipacnadales bacterium]